MRRFLPILAVLTPAFFCAVLPAAAQVTSAPPPAKTILRSANDEPVTFAVLAEPQLALPLTEITRMFSLRRGVTLLTAFEDSATQAQKLIEGESGDVLITSHPTVLADLRQRGMTDAYSHPVIAADKLLLAARQNEELNTPRGLINALALQPVMLANPERHVEGLYGQQALPYLYYRTAMPAEPEVYGNRNNLYRSILNWGGIGIILGSEAQQNPDIDLTLPLADNSYPPIRYTALIIAGNNMPLARDFSRFLMSPEAQAIFARYGFMQP